MPSPDFLEKGRLKLHKAAKQAMQADQISYAQSYEQIKQEMQGQLANLS